MSRFGKVKPQGRVSGWASGDCAMMMVFAYESLTKARHDDIYCD
jgi:hypothetical protein